MSYYNKLQNVVIVGAPDVGDEMRSYIGTVQVVSGFFCNSGGEDYYTLVNSPFVWPERWLCPACEDQDTCTKEEFNDLIL